MTPQPRHVLPTLSDWLGQRFEGRRWHLPVLAAAFGLTAAFGLAPYGIWPAAILSIAAMFVLHRASGSAKRAFLVMWTFAIGYFAHGLLWIVEPFMVDAPRYGWMAPFALIFLASGLALFWAAAGYVSWRVGPSAATRSLALVLCLALAELGRAYVLTGFPWAGISQIWVGQGADLSLAWIGPHGLTVLTLILCALPGLVRGSLSIALSFLPVAGLALLGAAALSTLPAAPVTDYKVRLIQPNAPQDKKWDPAHIPTFFDRQVAFTEQQPRPDLIVWPETAVPTLLGNAGPALEVMAAAAGGVPVVTGIQRRDVLKIYNSMVVLDPSGGVDQIYDKHHLVPFGEYMPFGNLMARFGLYGFAANEGSGYTPGPGPRSLDFGALGRGLALICYEAVFPQDMRAPGARPDFLLQITNDAWFGEHSGPYQHLAQAQMRAIEQGLPMIRVANTGISAMIDPFGRILESLPLGDAGYLDAVLPQPGAPTFYARTGDWPIAVLLATIAIGTLVLKRRQSSAK